MAERYTVWNTVFESGERFPLLLDARTGVPLFDPTVFVISEFRARNRASATIEQVLRALKVTHKIIQRGTLATCSTAAKACFDSSEMLPASQYPKYRTSTSLTTRAPWASTGNGI